MPGLLPFVESRGGHQASPVPHEVPEHRSDPETVCPGIDRAGCMNRISAPRGEKAPGHHLACIPRYPVMGRKNDRDILGRSNVIPGNQRTRWDRHAKPLVQPDHNGNREPSAHTITELSDSGSYFCLSVRWPNMSGSVSGQAFSILQPVRALYPYMSIPGHTGGR